MVWCIAKTCSNKTLPEVKSVLFKIVFFFFETYGSHETVLKDPMRVACDGLVHYQNFSLANTLARVKSVCSELNEIRLDMN